MTRLKISRWQLLVALVLARRVVMGEAAGEIAVELPAQYKFGLRPSQKTSSAKLESKRLLYLSELLQKQ